MDKIPVGATIAHAYRFAFGKFFALLSIVWLPFAVLIPAGLLMSRQAALLSGAMAGRNLSGMGSTLLVIVPFYIVMLLLLLMQILGMTEQALGRRKGSPYFYFNIGRPLWLLAATVLLFLLVSAGLVVAAFAGGALLGLLTNLLGQSGRAIAIFLLFVGMLAIYLALIYAWVRMAFLMTPVVVAEDRIGLGRAWALGKGNFWRMFLILLAVLMPVFVIQITFMFTFLWQGMPPAAPAAASPAQLQAARAAAEAWNAAMAARMYHYWFITFPFFLVFSILFYGLVSGAQAFAYRSLIPDHEASAEAFS
jgi:hypothetical protein